MRHRTRTLLPFVTLVVLLPILFCPPAAAQAPFDAAELDRFLTALPQYLKFLEQQGDAIENIQSPDAWTAQAVGQKIQNYLAERGWDAQRFYYVAGHVAKGLAAAMVGERSPEMQQEMAASMAMIRDNPSLSQAMKDQMMAQMQNAMAQTRELESTAEDLPPQEMGLLRTNLKRIKNAFGIEE